MEAAITRDSTEGSPVVNLKFYKLPESKQGTGSAAQFALDAIDLGTKIGASRLDCHANIDRGAYTWARYGFIPYQDEWDKLRKFLKDGIETGRKECPDDQRQSVMQSLDNPDPRAIWSLADNNKCAKDLLYNCTWQGTLKMDYAPSLERTQNYAEAKLAKR